MQDTIPDTLDFPLRKIISFESVRILKILSFLELKHHRLVKLQQITGKKKHFVNWFILSMCEVAFCEAKLFS